MPEPRLPLAPASLPTTEAEQVLSRPARLRTLLALCSRPHFRQSQGHLLEVLADKSPAPPRPPVSPLRFDAEGQLCSTPEEVAVTCAASPTAEAAVDLLWKMVQPELVRTYRAHRMPCVDALVALYEETEQLLLRYYGREPG